VQVVDGNVSVVMVMVVVVVVFMMVVQVVEPRKRCSID
jgi:hypothetical protein